MNNFFQQNSQKIFISLIILILASSFAVDIFLLRTEASQAEESSKSAVTRVSPFADPTPRIDEEAASIVRENPEESCNPAALAPDCKTLPAGVWIFLLAAYVFLLIFNLSAGFGSAQKIRWFWETLFTFLALYAWYVYDGGRTFIWYPLYVLKFGLIIYLFYVYLLMEKMKKEKTEVV